MTGCIFCQIAAKIIESEVQFEDNEIIAFKDIRPMAPVHILIIPKKHIVSVADLEEGDIALAGQMIFVAKEIAQNLGIAKNGYKLLIRAGSHGGQEVDHLHLHLIGGAKLAEGIRPIS